MIIDKLIVKLSYLVYSVYFNSTFGGNFYSFLVAIDYTIFGLLLFLGSYPSVQYGDYIDTRSVNIYFLSDDVNSLIAVKIIFTSAMLLAFLVSLYIAISTKSYEDAKENSFFKKLLYAYGLVSRTVLTYIMIILFLCGLKCIVSSNSINDSSYYLLIIDLVIGSFLYVFTIFLAFILFSLPLLNATFPWTNISNKYIFIREL